MNFAYGTSRIYTLVEQGCPMLSNCALIPRNKCLIFQPEALTEILQRLVISGVTCNLETLTLGRSGRASYQVSQKIEHWCV